MAEWKTCEVIENRFWSDALFSLKVRWPAQDFHAGQFSRLALTVNGERVQRAYSLVNPPGADYAEFYLIHVPDGRLSSALAGLAPGDAVEVSVPPSGFFTLEWLPDGDALWMISTGTGIGPYLSMLATATPWQRFEKIILLHGVRWIGDLAYRPLIASWQQDRGEQFVYQPVVSREAMEGALRGRIPALIRDGQLQRACGAAITPHSQVMLCGNPEMIKETRTLLQEMGLKKNLRRNPGQITVEQYWQG